MQDWGWRVPFALGLLLVPVAVYLRRVMPETLHASPVQAAHAGLAGLRRKRGSSPWPCWSSWGHGLDLCWQFHDHYAITTLKMPPTVAMGATVVVGVVTGALACWVAG